MTISSHRKIHWGILSSANIGIAKVIPAIQQSLFGEVTAIASRSLDTARNAAAPLQIPQAYGSYDELLADDNIDAIYNPLPNHLHVEWSIRALEAGKHVLCEKPIGLTASEGEVLLEAAHRHPRQKVMEAFMYRHHPQWQHSRQLIESGAIGKLRTIQSAFCYNNTDPANIRNRKEYGGGGLMDIGCYNISLSRFLYGSEPIRVMGTIDFDPEFGTDRLCSAIMEFEQGTSSFICSTQAAPYQRVNAMGAAGRIEIQVPFNAPPDEACSVWLQDDRGLHHWQSEPCDQYTVQSDLFCKAILEDTEVPTPLEDAVANMRVIEAIMQSARQESWVTL
jgi:predicted dehydrogenase